MEVVAAVRRQAACAAAVVAAEAVPAAPGEATPAGIVPGHGAAEEALGQ